MTSNTQLEIDDLIVLLLGAPAGTQFEHGRIEGITRLEKLLFLLEKEPPLALGSVEDAGFHAHNFGPFSKKVYQAIDVLAAAGLVSDSAKFSSSTDDNWETNNLIGFNSDPYSTRDFELTTRGKRYYAALLEDLPHNTETRLSQFKSLFATQPLRSLIRYVYQRYPDYTEKSVIKNKILE